MKNFLGKIQPIITANKVSENKVQLLESFHNHNVISYPTVQPVVNLNLPSATSFQPAQNNIPPYNYLMNSLNQKSVFAAQPPTFSHSTVQKTADWSNYSFKQ